MALCTVGHLAPGHDHCEATRRQIDSGYSMIATTVFMYKQKASDKALFSHCPAKAGARCSSTQAASADAAADVRIS